MCNTYNKLVKVWFLSVTFDFSLLTHYLVTYAKPLAQTCIQHITSLCVLSTKDTKGSHITLFFIFTAHSLSTKQTTVFSSTYKFPVTYTNAQKKSKYTQTEIYVSTV